MKTLVLGLGNDLLSDDAVGILAVRALKRQIGHHADVVESDLTGLGLMDILAGYDKVIIIDAVQTTRFRPGTIIDIDPKDLDTIPNPSPHYTGLPEMIAIAGQLNIDFPGEIKIMAIEVADHCTLGGELSKPVADALHGVVDRARLYLQRWESSID
jgi:hydrogenase maturation protease